MPGALMLEVVTSERGVVRESVAGVQLPGSNGYLGILPGHTPLLTELGIGALHYQQDGETRYVAILGGFAEVLPDRVTVLDDAAELAEEIDMDSARAALTASQAALSSGPADAVTDWAAAQRSVAEAQARLEVAAHRGPGAGRR